MNDENKPYLYEAYVFLAKGLRYKIREILVKGIDDKSIPLQTREIIHNALNLCSKNDFDGLLAYMEENLSAHERLKAKKMAQDLLIKDA